MPRDKVPKTNSVQKLDFSKSNADRLQEIYEIQQAIHSLCNALILEHNMTNDEVVGFLFDRMIEFRQAKYEDLE